MTQHDKVYQIIDGKLILNCGLCKFPVLGVPRMIEGHDYEYCASCCIFLRRAGFVVL